MTPFAHTGSTLEKLLKREICRIKSFTHWRKLCLNIAYSSGEIKLWKFQWRHSRIPEVLSKSFCSMIYAEFSPLFTGANCINIINSSGEIKLWKFQWRHLRIPEVLSKKLFNSVWCRISSFFHWRKLRINIAYSSGEIRLWIFNDVIPAYRKYFPKSCPQTKCVEFDSVLPATNCSSISLTVLKLFTFNGIYDVIFVNRK